MKNYIAPEMEITNFKAMDILTVSGNEPTTPVTITGEASTALSADREIKFSQDGAF